MQQGRQVEHQFKVANDLGDTSFWVSPKFSFMKNLSQSIVPNPMFLSIATSDTPTLTWVDFHQKINPIPFPEMDFPEETRLLWCVLVCFVLVENQEFSREKSPANPANPPSSRMMAVLWRSSGEPARWRWEQVTGDRW